MIEIKIIFKNQDIQYYYTNNRHRACEYFNRFKNQKYIKEIKTKYLERGKENK